MVHQPKRSDATKHTGSSDVFKRFGGLTRTAKAGRGYRIDERGPFKTPTPGTRKK